MTSSSRRVFERRSHFQGRLKHKRRRLERWCGRRRPVSAFGLFVCYDMVYRARESLSATPHTHLWLVLSATGYIIPARIGRPDKHSMHASIMSDEPLPCCDDRKLWGTSNMASPPWLSSSEKSRREAWSRMSIRIQQSQNVDYHLQDPDR